MKKTVFEVANELKLKGKKFALVTNTFATGSVPGKEGTMMIVDKDGIVSGTIGGGKIEGDVISRAKELLAENKNDFYDFVLTSEGNGMSCGGRVKGYINIIQEMPTLYIFGAGHIGTEIYNIAKNLDFRIVIIDSREEFCSKEKFSEATNIICEELDVAARKIEVDENSYIVIVSKGHAEDEKALLGLEGKKAAYIGLMGSKRKLILMKQKFKEINKENLFDGIYAPIGLNISNGSVNEIAMGILSEVLAVKNGEKLSHRKDL